MSYLLDVLAAQKDRNAKRREANRPRTDSDLPFNLRVDALVELPEHQFSGLMFKDQLKIQFPGVENHVVGYSRPYMFNGSECRNVYLASIETKAVSFLQIIPSVDESVADEMILWRESQSEDEKPNPKTDDDWYDWWVDLTDYRLAPGFQMTEEQWAYCQEHPEVLTPEQLCEKRDASMIGGAYFNLPDGTTYFRKIDNDGYEGLPAWIEPVHYQERIVYDPYGDKVHTIDHFAMIYIRGLQPKHGVDEAEYCLVSKEEDKYGVRIRIYFGVRLSRPINVS